MSIASGLLHGEIHTRSMAAFTPMAGTTLVQQDICNLNFYNQVTAANATVRKPNRSHADDPSGINGGRWLHH